MMHYLIQCIANTVINGEDFLIEHIASTPFHLNRELKIFHNHHVGVDLMFAKILIGLSAKGKRGGGME